MLSPKRRQLTSPSSGLQLAQSRGARYHIDAVLTLSY